MSRLAQIPRLFPSDAVTFASQGLGALTDAISCKVTEDLNGGMELVLVYPVEGVHFSEIAARELILAKPNPVSDPYPFRIYSITKPMNGRCTINAHGWHYDLSGVPIAPFSSLSAAGVMTAYNNDTAVTHVFDFDTTVTNAGSFNLGVPSSVFATMGGSEGSVIDIFGGEWIYGYNNDPTKIRLAAQRGQNRGVTIRYGKNLTSLEQEENIANVYTGVYPYWADTEGTVVTLPEEIVPVSGTFDFVRILTLDLTADFEMQPSETDLRNKALSYITTNEIGKPKVSLTVNFALLSQTDQYANAILLEDVELGDTVAVEFSELGVASTSRAVTTVYDPLNGKFDSVTLGSSRTTIADTIATQENSVHTLQTTVAAPIVSAVNRLTDRIVGNLGGYIVTRYNADGVPYEQLIMDTDSIDTATKVWRWNASGLGYSSTGYNGPYTLGLNQDGEIVADLITAGKMRAERITMGAVPGDDLTNYLDVGLDSNNKIVIAIGAADNQIILKIQNDRISFYDTQDNELAFFSDNAFQIVSLESFILQGLKIATLANGAYGFMATS